MNYKNLCKKYFPHVEIVRDFTESKYHLSPAKRASKSQKELVEIDALLQKEFSEEREKHGFSYGGSDIPIILGKGFIPPSQLAEQKKNPAVKGKVSAATQALFDTGHRAEDSIREAYERVSGYRTIPWPIMMRNPQYPHFLMNIDGLFFKDKTVCLYEGKWSKQWQIIRDHWKAARNARKDGFEPGLDLVPEKYLYQVWGYLAGLNLDLAVICGGWGYADDEIGYIYIPRLDKAKEKDLMETCESFIKIVEAGGEVSDTAFANKAKLNDFYKKLHAQLPDSGKAISFPSSDMESAREYVRLHEQIKELEKSIDEDVTSFKEQLEEIAGIKAMKEKRDKIQTYFEGTMKGNSLGEIEADGEKAMILYKNRAPRKTFQKELCKEKYPEIFEEVYTGTPTKSFEIKLDDKK